MTFDDKRSAEACDDITAEQFKAVCMFFRDRKAVYEMKGLGRQDLRYTVWVCGGIGHIHIHLLSQNNVPFILKHIKDVSVIDEDHMVLTCKKTPTYDMRFTGWTDPMVFKITRLYTGNCIWGI